MTLEELLLNTSSLILTLTRHHSIIVFFSEINDNSIVLSLTVYCYNILCCEYYNNTNEYIVHS